MMIGASFPGTRARGMQFQDELVACRTTTDAARPNPSTVAANYEGPDDFNLAVGRATVADHSS